MKKYKSSCCDVINRKVILKISHYCPENFCDVINFEINLIFLIKSFFYMTKKSRQNLDILRMKRAFKVKKKHFLIIFKGFSVAKFLNQVSVTMKELKEFFRVTRLHPSYIIKRGF